MEHTSLHSVIFQIILVPINLFCIKRFFGDLVKHDMAYKTDYANRFVSNSAIIIISVFAILVFKNPADVSDFVYDCTSALVALIFLYFHCAKFAENSKEEIFAENDRETEVDNDGGGDVR